ncbi:MAG: hypothetical protein WCO44_08830 [Bacteroidota bacterium]
MKKPLFLILIFYGVVATLTIVFFNGTGDAGDSVLHFLFAKYAPAHPGLFFDMWGKPVFVLLAFPFAHFGFGGIKVFNALTTLLTITLTYKTADALQIKSPYAGALLIIFMPLYYILTFSGLTEPLFALFVAAGLFLAVKQKMAAGAIFISFLPFVRSEGLVMIGVFVCYLLVKKQWKILPFLLFGSGLYSIAGYFVHHDILWVFTRIPYASLSSPYGSGDLLHFVRQMFYVVGFPVYALFVVGFFSLIINAFRSRIRAELHLLVLLGFSCFFLAHTLFWYFGIFNSMGLKRVLIGVMPLIAIIALVGFNQLTEGGVLGKSSMSRIVSQLVLLGAVIIFPFTAGPAAVNWNRDMMLAKDQQVAISTAKVVKSGAAAGCRILCGHPYLCEALEVDWFDTAKRIDLTRANLACRKAGDIIIWENWFAVVGSAIGKPELDATAGLKNIFDTIAMDSGHEIHFSVYGVSGAH